MLRNSTQAQQRSIVRITFVSGKRKLGCIITNCFQIGPFLRSKLLPKLRADTDTSFSRILIFSLKCRVSGHSPTSETWLHFVVKSPTSFLLCVWNQCAFGILLHTRLWNGFWLTDISSLFQKTGSFLFKFQSKVMFWLTRGDIVPED